MFIESMNQPITNWLNLNYVACRQNSIPRCIIYQHYCEDFKQKGIEPLNTAMFGKVIKMAFPFIRSRRLGNRGNSKYHYFGVAAKRSSIENQEKETLSEKIFIQKYAEIHRVACNNFITGKYMKAYQELKNFWIENITSFVSSKNIEQMCNIIESNFFGMLLSKAITSDSILDLDRVVSPENIIYVKTTAKTIILMCRQIFPVANSRGIFMRIECYKKYAAALNSVGNIQKYINILQKKYSMRAELEECRSFLSTGLCIVHESISLDKSTVIHVGAASLISVYMMSNTFQEFLADVDSHVTSLLYKKEKIPQDLVTLYFTGILQECISFGVAGTETIISLFSFYVEHFSLVNSSLCELSLKKRELASPSAATADLSVEEKSFVSQIIKQC